MRAWGSPGGPGSPKARVDDPTWLRGGPESVGHPPEEGPGGPLPSPSWLFCPPGAESAQQ